jgi:hypothetical protein
MLLIDIRSGGGSQGFWRGEGMLGKIWELYLREEEGGGWNVLKSVCRVVYSGVKPAAVKTSS